jgi:hypothetical protein
MPPVKIIHQRGSQVLANTANTPRTFGEKENAQCNGLVVCQCLCSFEHRCYLTGQEDQPMC